MRELGYDTYSEELHAYLASLGTAGSRVPIEGMLELTRLCSLRCTHCYLGESRWTKDPGDLSTSEVKELLDTLAERGTIWLCFTGGEPLLRPDFRELWMHAKKKGFILTLFSNATLIDESMAGFLEEYPPFNLEVSIYGATEGTYEAVTRVRGSYRRFLRGIGQLRAREIPWKLKAMLLKENARELEAMAELAREWGVSFKFDGSINPSIEEARRGEKTPCASRVSHEELIRAEVQEPDRVADLRRLLSLEDGKGQGERLYDCGAGENSFYVDARGKLQMCILASHRGYSLKQALSIGEAFDRGWALFDEIRELRRNPTSPCLTCEISAVCENCPAFAHLENSDEHGAVEFLCQCAHQRAAALRIPSTQMDQKNCWKTGDSS